MGRLSACRKVECDGKEALSESAPADVAGRRSSSSAIRRSSAARTFARSLGDAYAEALWAAHKHMNESAPISSCTGGTARRNLLTRKGTRLRRFGFVTTNSITQDFQRRVDAKRHLEGKTADVAADGDSRSSVDQGDDRSSRRAHRDDGRRSRAARRHAARGHRAKTSSIPISRRSSSTNANGQINADLTVGVDVTVAASERQRRTMLPGRQAAW